MEKENFTWEIPDKPPYNIIEDDCDGDLVAEKEIVDYYVRERGEDIPIEHLYVVEKGKLKNIFNGEVSLIQSKIYERIAHTITI